MANAAYVIVKQDDGKIASGNDEAGALLGCSSEPLSGQLLSSLLADFSAQDFSPIALSQSSEFITDAKRQDGSTFTVVLSVSHIVLSDVDYLHILIRKQKPLLQPEAINRAYQSLTSAPLAVWIIAEDGTVLYTNPMMTEMSGYAPEEVATASSWFAKAYGDDSEAIYASWQEDIADNFKTRDSIYTITCKDGSHKTIQYRANVIPGDSLTVFASDITERRQAEEKLIHSEALLSLAQEIAHVGHWTLDISSGDMLWSDEAIRIAGHDPSKTEASLEFLYRCTHPDDLQHLRAELEHALADSSYPYNVTHRIIRPDGEIRTVEERGKVEFGDDGTAQRVVGTALDVTDRKRAETLGKEKDAADRASQAKSDFLAVMSHEIRTPMNGILGMTELLSHTELSEQQNMYLGSLQESERILLTVINDILDYSKISAGKMELEKTPYSLKDCVSNLVNTYRFFETDHLHLSLCLDGNLPVLVLGDSVRLSQVLSNLLSNAFKFTQSGTVSVTVSVLESTENKNLIRFSVADSGIGITEEAKAALFDMFSQADSSTSRKYGGTGLGLAICRSLVELHEGNIWVESQFGHGANFEFDIPFGIVQQGSVNDEIEVTSTNEADFKNLKILVAEDNVINQKVIMGFLKKAGLSAELVEDGREAVRVFCQADFDLVLMDCEMPHLDGYEATQKIRQYEMQQGRSPCFIVALTAHVLQEFKEKGYSSGMNHFLSKPLSMSKLNETLTKAVLVTT